MKHLLNLCDSPFRLIKSGKKIYELRLYDERRKKIKVNDELEFTNNTTGEKMNVIVEEILIYKDFKELYDSLPLLKCGYTEDDIKNATYKDMELYYSEELQNLYNVVAFKIRLLK